MIAPDEFAEVIERIDNLLHSVQVKNCCSFLHVVRPFQFLLPEQTLNLINA